MIRIGLKDDPRPTIKLSAAPGVVAYGMVEKPTHLQVSDVKLSLAREYGTNKPSGAGDVFYPQTLTQERIECSFLGRHVIHGPKRKAPSNPDKCAVGPL